MRRRREITASFGAAVYRTRDDIDSTALVDTSISGTNKHDHTVKVESSCRYAGEVEENIGVQLGTTCVDDKSS